jgi:MoaA/NifB/PqqE/SkfB family radical SAM enzyme
MNLEPQRSGEGRQDGFERRLQFGSLVLQTIDRCTASCGMCYQAAGPRGSDLRGDGRLALDVIKSVIDQAVQIKEIGDRVHVGGGEAFINYQDVLCIFRYAKLRAYAG